MAETLEISVDELLEWVKRYASETPDKALIPHVGRYIEVRHLSPHDIIRAWLRSRREFALKWHTWDFDPGVPDGVLVKNFGELAMYELFAYKTVALTCVSRPGYFENPEDMRRLQEHINKVFKLGALSSFKLNPLYRVPYVLTDRRPYPWAVRKSE